MSGILDLISSDLGKTIICNVHDQSRQSKSKTGSILSMTLHILMQAM